MFLARATIMVAMMLSVNSAFAECPTTNCSTDCASGETCTITQYDSNGALCSTTTCHGYGADFGGSIN